MGRKKTHTEFIEELKIVNPEITVIGEYVNAVTKIKVKHTCGYKWKVTPNSLLKGNYCPKCSRIESGKKQKNFPKMLIFFKKKTIINM